VHVPKVVCGQIYVYIPQQLPLDSIARHELIWWDTQRTPQLVTSRGIAATAGDSLEGVSLWVVLMKGMGRRKQAGPQPHV